MEKILIKEDVNSQNATIASINSFCESVNSILSKFKEETGYSLSIDELRTLFANKNNLSDIVEKVNNTTLNTFAIELPPVLKRTLLTDCTKTVHEFATKLRNFSNYAGASYLQNYFTLENGELTLSPEDEQNIRDNFRVFITSREGEEFYKKHKEICKQLSDFANYVFDKTDQNYGIDGLTKYYFQNGFDREILPIVFDYEKAIKRVSK